MLDQRNTPEHIPLQANEVDKHLARLNAAMRLSLKAKTRQDRQQKDELFSRCWDWLTVHSVAFHLDDMCGEFVPGETVTTRLEPCYERWHEVTIDDRLIYAGQNYERAADLVLCIMRLPERHSIKHTIDGKVSLSAQPLQEQS